MRIGWILLVVIYFAFTQCSTDPEPLKYGTDVCHFCKMTLVDEKFGAELVTKRGKVFKFDDVNCMINYYRSGYEEQSDFEHKLVVDFKKPGTLISAETAFYLKSKEIHSPMGSEVAAFESMESLTPYKRDWNGIYLVWGELITQFN